MNGATLMDTMVNDGLTDAFSSIHMGVTAENLVNIYNISREEQDEHALQSHFKANEANSKGAFKDEIVNMEITSRKNTITINQDENIRDDMTIDKLSSLKPAFVANGSVTAGNSSSINDGAAALLVMHRSTAEKYALTPLCTIRSWGQSGVNPETMGIGPVSASKAALRDAKWNVDDLDLIEANEAFSAQAIAVNKEMQWNVNKVNVNGGAIALGHPIGASGARVLVTLIHSLRKRGGGRGLATLCVGGGMGVAMCIEC